MAEIHPHRSTTDFFSDPLDSNPLWFKKHAFLEPEFDSEAYIADLRTFVPFDTLRSELHAHLSSLKHELVDLINRDYNDFVNLSTKLVDVDGAVVRMRAPLLELREKIEQFRDGVESSLVALQNGLRQRTEASSAREVLELLLDTFHVVSKVEKLIKELPNVPADKSNGEMNAAEKDPLSNGTSWQHLENGTNERETQSMLLERIASEMNRLKFYIARAQDLPFIQNMEKRIQSASLLLDGSLGHCLVNGLEHRDEVAIFNCLRAYAAIDNMSHAEEIFRTTVVSPMVQKIISHGFGVVAGANGDELENDYHQLKEGIEKRCKFFLEISSAENSGLHVFSFLANSILKEVLSAIQKGKPGAFSPGRPTEFLKNYRSSLDFLAYLEGFCPSSSAVVKFRSESVYVEFMKQWNVGAYFTIRFQEIAGGLDAALIAASLTPIQSSDSVDRGLKHVTLKQSAALLDSLRGCWRDDVFIVSCSDKFLRLCLQLLSRYSHWLSTGLSARKTGSANSSSASEWAISAATDDFIYILHDLNCLKLDVSGDYLEHVLKCLSSCSSDTLGVVKQSILEGVKSLDTLAYDVIDTIVQALFEKSVEHLKHIKGISATYRMTNKPVPSRYSNYVSGVLRPLKAYLEGQLASKYLTTEMKNELLQRAAIQITDCYYELAADIVNVARKTETSLMKLRQGAQKRNAAGGGTNTDSSDSNVSTDKIRMQLFLDIQEYARNLSALGVEPAKIPSYHSLWNCVAPSDKQGSISF
uniref:Conserved oligomeric Golgi complex subunit 2 n=1 Tax=Kalanchoe fedtschenkoi TaxID=63787 RepID=A0A7N0VGM5_KALFE